MALPFLLARLPLFFKFRIFTKIINCHKIRWLHIYIVFY